MRLCVPRLQGGDAQQVFVSNVPGSGYGAIRLFISICPFTGLVDAELKQKELFRQLLPDRVTLLLLSAFTVGPFDHTGGMEPPAWHSLTFLCHASVDSTLLGTIFLFAQFGRGELP